MMTSTRHSRASLFAVAAWLLAGTAVNADVATDWNVTASEIVAAARLAPAVPYRAVAIVQSAVHEAVNGVSGRYPADRVKLDPAPSALLAAAVAAANRAALSKLAPSQHLRPGISVEAAK